MFKRIAAIRFSLIAKLIIGVGIMLLISISAWAYYVIDYQRNRMTNEIVEGTDRLSTTIKLGTHYAMMLNSRDDIYEIIKNIGRHKEIEHIRIYNKAGQIKYSNQLSEVDQTTNINAEACYICHKSEPPLTDIPLAGRIRIFESADGHRMLGVISPIHNEPGCAASTCHVHPAEKKILGALDVVVPLDKTDREIVFFEKGVISLAMVAFIVASTVILILVMRFVSRPIKNLIDGTERIAKGDYASTVEVGNEKEMGRLAEAINQMSTEIGEKQSELNRQRDEYQNLFEMVPCIITVQDKDYRLIQYNKEFSDRFSPMPREHCFRAYKGRDKKCEICPVEKTFADGQSHYSEEKGFKQDGSPTHWVVKTAPIKDADGEIVAAMEMVLDITRSKLLEEKLKRTEKKYQTIFNTIPNPVFILEKNDLKIIECNQSVRPVYGYDESEMVDRTFLDLFADDEKEQFADNLTESTTIDQVKHIRKDGTPLFVSARISPFEYIDRKVLLVTTTDITKRLEAEQQLIQASKMATLGEMATGVAHELNQPLSVIKTASTFFMKKIRNKEKIKDDILYTMSEEIDSYVNRATKIIGHMRQFGRKSDMTLVRVDVNDLLQRSFEIFRQQLKVRGIAVAWHLSKRLPDIMVDPDRLEQVFVNLFINARDAIEEKWENCAGDVLGEKRITIRTLAAGEFITVELCDTGTGIPAGIRDKIFEPFFTTKEVGKGTGLGLSISYGIIKDCGGDIQATSHDGQGTCFTINFPKARDE